MVLYTENKLKENAGLVAMKALPGDIFLLSGDLGTGKTTWTQGFASALGVKEDVTSPTFLILNEYHSGKIPIYHIDTYRLNRPEDIFDIGLEDLLKEQAIIIIEWPDFIRHLLPDKYLEVVLEYYLDGRKIEYYPNGGMDIFLRRD